MHTTTIEEFASNEIGGKSRTCGAWGAPARNGAERSPLLRQGYDPGGPGPRGAVRRLPRPRRRGVSPTNHHTTRYRTHAHSSSHEDENALLPVDYFEATPRRTHRRATPRAGGRRRRRSGARQRGAGRGVARCWKYRSIGASRAAYVEPPSLPPLPLNSPPPPAPLLSPSSPPHESV